MREHLIRYVDLLFAGAADAADIKQEILQNTLDRYDDLVDHGKSPEAAYQLAISGIGDIREILSGHRNEASPVVTGNSKPNKPMWKKVLQAIAICLYILSPLPMFILQNELGLCGLLAICAVATAMIIIGSSGETKEKPQETPAPQKELQKAIGNTIAVVGLCIYLGVSFLTNAWYITWIIFPLCAAINGLVRACLDLKEASKYEN